MSEVSFGPATGKSRKGSCSRGSTGAAFAQGYGGPSPVGYAVFVLPLIP